MFKLFFYYVIVSMFKLPKIGKFLNIFFGILWFTYNLTAPASKWAHKSSNERDFFALQSVLGCACYKVLVKGQEAQV